MSASEYPGLIDRGWMTSLYPKWACGPQTFCTRSCTMKRWLLLVLFVLAIVGLGLAQVASAGCSACAPAACAPAACAPAASCGTTVAVVRCHPVARLLGGAACLVKGMVERHDARVAARVEARAERRASRQAGTACAPAACAPAACAPCACLTPLPKACAPAR